MLWWRSVTGFEVAIGSAAVISEVAISNGHCTSKADSSWPIKPRMSVQYSINCRDVKMKISRDLYWRIVGSNGEALVFYLTSIFSHFYENSKCNHWPSMLPGCAATSDAKGSSPSEAAAAHLAAATAAASSPSRSPKPGCSFKTTVRNGKSY